MYVGLPLQSSDQFWIFVTDDSHDNDNDGDDDDVDDDFLYETRSTYFDS